MIERLQGRDWYMTGQSRSKGSDFSAKVKQGFVMGVVVLGLLYNPEVWKWAMVVVGAASLLENLSLIPRVVRSGNILRLLAFMSLSAAGSLSAIWLRADDVKTRLLITVLFTTAATDIFAQLAGRKFGKDSKRPKPFPYLSKNKTWEGLAGGCAGGFIAFWVFAVLLTDLSVLLIAPLALILPVASILGDLFASSVKRALNIDDFSNIMGQHGGVNDRVDSQMSAITTARLYANLFLF